MFRRPFGINDKKPFSPLGGNSFSKYNIILYKKRPGTTGGLSGCK
jgi:hypothetical protein